MGKEKGYFWAKIACPKYFNNWSVSCTQGQKIRIIKFLMVGSHYGELEGPLGIIGCFYTRGRIICLDR